MTGVGFDPRGRVIVTASDDGTARLWSANAGDQLEAIDHRAGPVDALFADDHVLTVTGREARLLTTGGRVLQRFGDGSTILSVATSPTSIALASSRSCSR